MIIVKKCARIGSPEEIVSDKSTTQEARRYHHMGKVSLMCWNIIPCIGLFLRRSIKLHFIKLYFIYPSYGWALNMSDNVLFNSICFVWALIWYWDHLKNFIAETP